MIPHEDMVILFMISVFGIVSPRGAFLLSGIVILTKLSAGV